MGAMVGSMSRASALVSGKGTKAEHLFHHLRFGEILELGVRRAFKTKRGLELLVGIFHGIGYDLRRTSQVIFAILRAAARPALGK